MKVLLVLTAAISTAAAFGFLPPRAHLNRNVSYSCSKEGDIGTMKVNVHTADHLDLIYLEDPVNAAINTIGVLDSSGHGVTGDGSDFDPYYFEIAVNCSNSTLTVIDPAGLPSIIEDPDVLTIVLLLKSLYAPPWYESLYFLNDSRHELSCNFSETIPGEVTQLRFITSNIDSEGTQLLGGNAVLEMLRKDILNPTFVAGLGEPIFLRLKLAPGSQATGVVGYDCFACASDRCTHPVPLIDHNGCSLDPTYFTGFTFQGGYHVTSTFPAFMVEHQVLLFLTCSVDYCYVPGHPKCLDYCTFNTAPGRKKRQAEPESKPEIIRSFFRIEFSVPEGAEGPSIVQNQPADQSKKNSEVHLQNTGLLAAVVTLAALLLVCLFVAIVVFVHLFARNRRSDVKA